MRTSLLALSLILFAAGTAHADGKATFDKMCASCHGADGRGNAAKAKVLKLDAKLLGLGREDTAKLTRDERRAIVLEGKAKMPAYGKKLKPEEVDAVLDHADKLAEAIRGKAAATPAAEPASTAPAPAGVAAGKSIYDKMCASCHGADGRGSAAKAKALKIDAKLLDLGREEAAGLTEDERRAILLKGKAKMPGYEKKLTPADAAAVHEHTTKLAESLRGK